MTPIEKAQDYLRDGKKYQLGFLPTEQSHPLTRRLSDLAQTDLPAAYRLLKQVDAEAIRAIQEMAPQLEELRRTIREVLGSGGRIFLAGCGATGRLSLSLEFLWRQKFGDDRVVAFMAGGDVALVHALEGFEDFPEYGARHLEQRGFGENDLLISSTEGGETPFVIGATKRATEISRRPSYFAFCNPVQLLARVTRSREILTNPKVKPLPLLVGPMALAGSTRLQASTVLMLSIGICLLEHDAVNDPAHFLKKFADYQQSVDFSVLQKLTVREAELYLQKHFLMYETDHYGITVFTDTTERAPTFNLPAFDNQSFSKPLPSLCYVGLLDCKTGLDSWRKLLGRDPLCLEWTAINSKTSVDYLNGFDFGSGAVAFREKLTGEKQIPFTILDSGAAIICELEDLSASLPKSGVSLLFDHLILKLALNQHSTLLMGRMDRYKGNFMTWVYPTNGKLIDRATRYTQMWLEQLSDRPFSYEQVVQQIFIELESLTPQESIVMKAAQNLLRG